MRIVLSLLTLLSASALKTGPDSYFYRKDEEAIPVARRTVSLDGLKGVEEAEYGVDYNSTRASCAIVRPKDKEPKSPKGEKEPKSPKKEPKSPKKEPEERIISHPKDKEPKSPKSPKGEKEPKSPKKDPEERIISHPKDKEPKSPKSPKGEKEPKSPKKELEEAAAHAKDMHANIAARTSYPKVLLRV